LGQRGCQRAAGLFLQIDVTEIVVHKADQPNTVVDLFDAHGLTRERGAEHDFLFENANPPAVGNKSGPIVEGIGEFSYAAIGSRGGLVCLGRVLHTESFMGALVVELVNEGLELGLLLKEVGAGRPGSLYF
jgi:hypothetical protein